MPYLTFESAYEKQPIHPVEGTHEAVQGWAGVSALLKKEQKLLVVECYHGVDMEEIAENLRGLSPQLLICADEAAFSADEIKVKMADHITEDRVFGVMSFHRLEHFFHRDKIQSLKKRIESTKGLVIVYGVGASLIAEGGTLIYADMPRWELQLRMRLGKAANWRDSNYQEDILRRYKRGYFMEWRWADRHKQAIFPRISYFLDTVNPHKPVMISKKAFEAGMDQLVSQPFRLVPYFDPGVWGGQWMKEVCKLDISAPNYAWSFDGVPEENSIMLSFGGIVYESPAINLVFFRPHALLGERVFARFGAEFPIRFDFLDTMEGQNLSLQVHPTAEYAYQNFGIKYTQDESYYILDAKEGACVYLGLKEEADPSRMISDLREAEKGGSSFPAENHIHILPCEKHDHFLIPAGTIHCSGSQCMVLEISATPYIFTFKLWDWDRLGLDGRPRPVHISHGEKVINWERRANWVNKNLVNVISTLGQNEDFSCEKTGLHDFEFLETRRYKIRTKASIATLGGVHMINLVEGKEARIVSQKGSFKPYTLHYAETCIIPAACLEYTVEAVGEPVILMQAQVKP